MQGSINARGKSASPYHVSRATERVSEFCVRPIQLRRSSFGCSLLFQWPRRVLVWVELFLQILVIDFHGFQIHSVLLGSVIVRRRAHGGAIERILMRCVDIQVKCTHLHRQKTEKILGFSGQRPAAKQVSLRNVCIAPPPPQPSFRPYYRAIRGQYASLCSFGASQAQNKTHMRISGCASRPRTDVERQARAPQTPSCQLREPRK